MDTSLKSARMETANARLRRWRLEQGYTYEVAGDLLGCHGSYISHLEREKRQRPGYVIAVQIERLTCDWKDGPLRVDEWYPELHTPPDSI